MGGTLDDFVDLIREQIFEETRLAYGDAAYERWRNPLYRGVIRDPDGYAQSTGVCGDLMEIYLKFEDGRVKEASFRTQGCGASSVCASYAAELSLGKSPDEVLEIKGESIMEALGGLPREDEHLAFLAAETLHQAVNDYNINKSRLSARGPRSCQSE